MSSDVVVDLPQNVSSRDNGSVQSDVQRQTDHYVTGVGGARFENQIFDVSPKGIPHLAQGCRYSGYPGLWLRDSESTPTGLCPYLQSERYRSSQGHNPVGVGVSFVPRTQGSRQGGNPGLSDISPSGKDKPAIRGIQHQSSSGFLT